MAKARSIVFPSVEAGHFSNHFTLQKERSDSVSSATWSKLFTDAHPQCIKWRRMLQWSIFVSGVDPGRRSRPHTKSHRCWHRIISHLTFPPILICFTQWACLLYESLMFCLILCKHSSSGAIKEWGKTYNQETMSSYVGGFPGDLWVSCWGRHWIFAR